MQSELNINGTVNFYSAKTGIEIATFWTPFIFRIYLFEVLSSLKLYKTFYDLKKEGFENIVGKKENSLVSIFSFSHNVFSTRSLTIITILEKSFFGRTIFTFGPVL